MARLEPIVLRPNRNAYTGEPWWTAAVDGDGFIPSDALAICCSATQLYFSGLRRNKSIEVHLSTVRRRRSEEYLTIRPEDESNIRIGDNPDGTWVTKSVAEAVRQVADCSPDGVVYAWIYVLG